VSADDIIVAQDALFFLDPAAVQFGHALPSDFSLLGQAYLDSRSLQRNAPIGKVIVLAVCVVGAQGQAFAETAREFCLQGIVRAVPPVPGLENVGVTLIGDGGIPVLLYVAWWGWPDEEKSKRLST